MSHGYLLPTFCLYGRRKGRRVPIVLARQSFHVLRDGNRTTVGVLGDKAGRNHEVIRGLERLPLGRGGALLLVFPLANVGFLRLEQSDAHAARGLVCVSVVQI